MKILAFTDIHGSYSALRRIGQKSRMQDIDIIVCCGDITIFEHGIRSILRKLNKLGKKVVLVHGNHEDEKTYRKYSKTFKNLVFIHKKSYVYKNCLFIGYGGGGFSEVDGEFDRVAGTIFRKIMESRKGKKTILLTHAPPYRTKLDKLASGYCGSKSIRNFLEKNKLDLLVCGHIHENFGKEDKIKRIRILNPGPFGRVIEI